MYPTVIITLPSIRPTTVIRLSLRHITARKGYVASRRARETAMQIKKKLQLGTLYFLGNAQDLSDLFS